jgi:ferric-dicitrate binding protein FerR (iron transport regulator)
MANQLDHSPQQAQHRDEGQPPPAVRRRRLRVITLLAAGLAIVVVSAGVGGPSR